MSKKINIKPQSNGTMILQSSIKCPKYYKSRSCSYYAQFKEGDTFLQIYTIKGTATIQECHMTDDAVDFFVNNGCEITEVEFNNAYNMATTVFKNYLRL